MVIRVFSLAGQRLIAPTFTLGVTALLALGVGLLLYCADRPPGSVLLVPAGLTLFDGTGHLFGPVGGCTPSFLHTLAFALLMVVCLGTKSRSAILAVCLGWFLINAAFEVGQHPQVREVLVERLAAGLGPDWLVVSLRGYFLSGTYDAWDILAALLGAAAAYSLARSAMVRPHAEEH